MKFSVKYRCKYIIYDLKNDLLTSPSHWWINFLENLLRKITRLDLFSIHKSGSEEKSFPDVIFCFS
jgi:hypothetical protein